MLYYIHGYQSTVDSKKGTLFHERLNAQSIDYHQGKPEDLEIVACLRKIVEAIENDGDPVLIGSSLGGFLAAKVASEHSSVKSLILLNPLIIPPAADTRRLEGIPRRILSELMNRQLLKVKIAADAAILIATEDELIPRSWILEFAMAQEATVRFLHDDHSFTRNLTRLPGIIGEILRLRTASDRTAQFRTGQTIGHGSG